MTSTILNFGSINIDNVYLVEHFVQPGETLASLSLSIVLGGKGANQSVTIARAGVNVKHIGRVCKTDSWVFTQLESCGVDILHVVGVDEPSGHAIIQVDQQGENDACFPKGCDQSDGGLGEGPDYHGKCGKGCAAAKQPDKLSFL